MKFKPIALVVIGLLLGSTVTQYFVTPSTSTTEILACVSKTSGKTRLTTSGTCDNNTETETPVTDLWSLQPTTSAPPITAPLKKYVVDARGKTVGELVSNEGLRSFWILVQGGLFNISVGGYITGDVFSGDLSIFSDKQCQAPYFAVMEGDTYSQQTRAVVRIPKQGPPSDQFIRKAFRPTGSPKASPKFVYFYVTPSTAEYFQSRPNVTDPNFADAWATKAGCVRVELEKLKDQSGEVGVPKQVMNSAPVDIPTYTSPLSIVEK